jgi:rhamnulokinase
VAARFAAVDLGASSGRVLVVDFDRDPPVAREVHRFANRPVRVRGTLHWDVLALWAGVLDGLRRAGPGLRGVGVDSWAIDYALLDEDGSLLGNPVHYRDARTDGVAERVAFEGLYAVTGVQLLPFNTVFQLVAAQETAALRQAARALLIPDLFGYWLTGEVGTELTNASTTGLLDVRGREWSTEVHDRLGLPRLFPPIRQPGTPLGRVLPSVGVGEPEVFTVGSHDTASAVVGVPARHERVAYVCCGAWSLVGGGLAVAG